MATTIDEPELADEEPDYDDDEPSLNAYFNRRIQFTNVTGLLNFATNGIDHMDLEDFVRDLDHGVEYFKRYARGDTTVGDDPLDGDDIFSMNIKLRYIKDNMNMCREYLSVDDYNKLRNELMPIIESITKKIEK